MAHLIGENGPREVEDAQSIAHNTRLGLWLFAAYLLTYGVFVLANAFWPSSMSHSLLGTTAAVVCGLGLIVLALVLSLVYCGLCVETSRGPDRQPTEGADTP